MAKLRIDISVLEHLLFGYAVNPVAIASVAIDSTFPHQIVLEISGPDVPEAEKVNAICREQSNRAGQRLCTMSFEAAE